MVETNKIPTTAEIEALIGSIPDPEIPVITIKELGILRNIAVDGSQCTVTLTPTYTACPAIPLIESQVKEILAAHGIKNVVIQLVYSPAWTTDWISDQTKSKLIKYGIAPPRHTSCKKIDGSLDFVRCPRCGSAKTSLVSRFGSTACKALYQCQECRDPFEYFKCHV